MYPSMEEIEGMSNGELAELTLAHLKQIMLPRVTFDIPKMNKAHRMIEGLEAWIADLEGVERAGLTHQMRIACINYCANNLHR